ncbi:MAG: hypothetical protein MZV64_11285 [Ignavibacteriales bacterium]|nr:hypothetical protein [Ignavibacteriales bacterium]
MIERADMSSFRCLAAFAAALLTAAVPLRRPVQGQEFDRGKLIEKVACREEPEQTYALYLPSAFDPDKKWPVLFLFDPGARGATAVEVFPRGGRNLRMDPRRFSRFTERPPEGQRARGAGRVGRRLDEIPH